MKKNRSLLTRLTALLMSALMCLGLSGCELSDITEFFEWMEGHQVIELTMTEDGCVVLDCRQARLTIESFSIEQIGIGGEPTANLVYTIENRTDGKYAVFMDDIAVNGWMMNQQCGHVPEPGETVTETEKLFCSLSHTYYTPADCGITEITDISFTLRHYEWDDSIETTGGTEYIIYASGITSDTVVRTDRRTGENEQVILDTSHLNLTALEFDEFDSSFITSPTDLSELFPNDPYAYLYTNMLPEPPPFYRISAYIENKTDEVLSFSWTTQHVNRMSIDDSTSTILQPFAKGYITLYFSTDDLYRYGMLDVDQITGHIHLSELHSKTVHFCGECTIYPTGLTADTLPEYERVPEEFETLLVDDDHCLFICTYEPNDNDYLYTFFIENRTDQPLYVFAHDLIINDVSYGSLAGITIAPHTMQYGHFPSMSSFVSEGNCRGSCRIVIEDDLPSGEADAYRYETGVNFSVYVED